MVLFTQTELHEFSKLPEFIKHFTEHRSENKNLSLMDFLKLHYFNGDVKDTDYDQDMKLPFKSHDFTQISSLHFSVPSVQQFSLNSPLTLRLPVSIAYNDWIPGSVVEDIFQPPKFS